MEGKERKTVVLYRSKYGSTKRYAEWIAKATCADLFDASEFDESRLDDYDMVVFGSSVRIARIRHIDFITRNWDYLSRKNLVIFAVGGAPTEDTEQKRLLRQNLPPEVAAHASLYLLQGAFDYNRLDLADRLLMNGPRMKLLMGWFFGRRAESRQMLDNLTVPQDWTSKEAVQPIVALVNRSGQGR